MTGSADGLAGRLSNPARRVALADLPGQWFHSIAVVRCRGARSLALDPKIAGKLRGVWGAQLKATASAEAIAGEACRWQPPCALDVFFRTQGRITPALEIPKPYVLALLADGADLLVRLTLFGFATDWTEAAVEALVRACRATSYRGRPLEVIDRHYWSEESIPAVEASADLVLAFETPIEIRLMAYNSMNRASRDHAHLRISVRNLRRDLRAARERRQARGGEVDVSEVRE